MKIAANNRESTVLISEQIFTIPKTAGFRLQVHTVHMFIKRAFQIASQATGLSNYWDIELLDTTCSTIQILHIFLSVVSDKWGVGQVGCRTSGVSDKCSVGQV